MSGWRTCVSVGFATRKQGGDLGLARHDLLMQRMDKKAALLDLSAAAQSQGRQAYVCVLSYSEGSAVGCKQVLERLVVDLDVRHAQEVLALGVAGDVVEDVVNGLCGDARVRRRARLRSDVSECGR